MEKKIITVLDANGKKIECEIISTFYSEENKKYYVVFTDNTVDEKGNKRVYASSYDPNIKETEAQDIDLSDPNLLQNAADLVLETKPIEQMVEQPIHQPQPKPEPPKKPKYENLRILEKKEEPKEVKKEVKTTPDIKKREKDEPKKEKKITFKYTVRKNEKIEKGTFDAFNIEQVKMFLHAEGYEIISIVPSSKFDINLSFGAKLKPSELAFALTQLSTYIKAGIPLIDSVRILSKQTVKPNKKKIYDALVYELLTGQSFSAALERQENVFPKLLVNMVKTAEMTGDLTAILDDMADYYTAMDQTRKQIVSAMTYPTIVLIFAMFVLTFVLVWVVPKFVTLFKDNNSELPGITKVIIAVSDFLSNNLFLVLVVLTTMLLIYVMLYRRSKKFRKAMQTFYMRLPVIGNIMIYSEVTMFTKTLASLLNHGVFITDSMEILSKVSSNELYRDMIARTINNLTDKGGKISECFQGQWFFPIVAYEMIVTGENTGQLGLMMEKVSQYYQDLHKNMVQSLKNLIEPIMIAFLAVAVGIIILSIILPMFSLYNVIQGS